MTVAITDSNKSNGQREDHATNEELLRVHLYTERLSLELRLHGAVHAPTTAAAAAAPVTDE